LKIYAQKSKISNIGWL